jgi:hypothetical protein
MTERKKMLELCRDVNRQYAEAYTCLPNSNLTAKQVQNIVERLEQLDTKLEGLGETPTRHEVASARRLYLHVKQVAPLKVHDERRLSKYVQSLQDRVDQLQS